MADNSFEWTVNQDRRGVSIQVSANQEKCFSVALEWRETLSKQSCLILVLREGSTKRFEIKKNVQWPW